MFRKSFIAPDGTSIGNPNDDHADQARAYLASKGIKAKDYADLYTQMFALGFARASEDSTQFHIERPQGLSRAQKAETIVKLLSGKDVFVNDRRFTESKGRNDVASLIEQLKD